MMKFNHLAETATVGGKIVKADQNFENADWVSDTEGTYAILNIDWNRKMVDVAEIGFDDDTAVVRDRYSRTFSDMKNCEY